MERDSLEKLQYDKRLRLRNGWISKAQEQSYIDALPDVSDKIFIEEEEEPEAQEQAVEAPVGAPTDPMAEPADTAVETPLDPLSPPPFREV